MIANLMTRPQYEQLIRNGLLHGKSHHDPAPVLKLLLKGFNCAWLLTELDPYDPLTGFGLCDEGCGFPYLGHVDLSGLAKLKLPGGIVLQTDPDFTPQHAISIYARAARECGQITEDPVRLNRPYLLPAPPVLKPA